MCPSCLICPSELGQLGHSLLGVHKVLGHLRDGSLIINYL